jgi:hypothetical protein
MAKFRLIVMCSLFALGTLSGCIDITSQSGGPPTVRTPVAPYQGEVLDSARLFPSIESAESYSKAAPESQVTMVNSGALKDAPLLKKGDAVVVSRWYPGDSFKNVTTSDGKKGFVASNLVSDPAAAKK